MDIQKYLNENKNTSIATVIWFPEFIEFYKSSNYWWNDLTIIKYSENNYIVQFHKFSKAQLVLNNKSWKILQEQEYFINSIINNENIIEPRKKDLTFIKFLYEEFKLRRLSFIVIFTVFFCLPYLFSYWLLDISKKLIEIFISLLGVYFAIMIVFLTFWGFKYSHELFINWKLSYFYNVDKNLAKLTLYSIFYLIIILIALNILWNKWYTDYHLRNIGFSTVWFALYLLYINFINLIDFYINKISYIELSNYKNNFFEYNYNSKNNK